MLIHRTTLHFILNGSPGFVLLASLKSRFALNCVTNVVFMGSAHSPTFPSLHLRHNSFANPSVSLPTSQLILQPFVASPTSQLILQPFCHFTYITAHSPILLSLHLHHSSFSNPSIASPASQLILQPFCHFTYITAHSPTLLLCHLCHSSFYNLSIASPMSQLIPRPFCSLPISQALHLHHLASYP